MSTKSTKVLAGRSLRAGFGVLAIALMIVAVSYSSGPSSAQAPAQGQGAPAQGRGGNPAPGRGGAPPITTPRVPDGPLEYDTSEQGKVRVVVVTRGLFHPWGMTFLPNGNILVTERPGRVRIIRQGVLDPTPVATVAVTTTFNLSGLMDIALHPRFAENNWIYLTYNKPGPNNARLVTLARGTWNGSTLVDIRDLFVTDAIIGASRIAFGRDGLIYWAVGGPPGPADAEKSQDPMQHTGKTLRLRDDGTVPDDNPFVGRAGYKPEIYSLGHRNQLGLTMHPTTGEIWESEQGPLGGDEVNIIKAGANYGWPLVSFGRWYEGPRVSANPYREGMELPVLYWVPSIALSGMTFYDGDRFPRWKGNLFVGGLQMGRTPRTGQLQRIVFNPQGDEARRETLLNDLKQRIRDVRQGPDGLLYVLTDENEAVLLRIEPIEATPARPTAGS